MEVYYCKFLICKEVKYHLKVNCDMLNKRYIYIINPEATTEITKQKVLYDKPTKEQNGITKVFQLIQEKAEGKKGGGGQNIDGTKRKEIAKL